MSAEATAPAPPAAHVQDDGGASPRLGLLLAVCCVAQFMVILDLSIVNVALPSIQSDLGFSSPGLQWVVDAYTITFAGFLMLGGRAADHFGQRRIFVLGLVLFALTSLAGGLAPDKAVLVVARGLQGFSGALMAASTLAIITASFAPGPPLNRAIGTWAATNGIGGAAGALLGGVITEFLSWRWILLINPPIGIAAAVVAYRVVAERRRAPEARFDLAGAVTLTVGQLILVYGVVEAGLAGWSSAKALVPICAGAVLLVAFGVIEDRFAKAPLIPFKELSKGLRSANNIVLLFSAALFPMWFVSSLYMQQVLGLSPFHTGLVFLPMTLAILVLASRAGKLVSAFGVRAVLGGGLVMMTVGLLLFTKINSSGSAWVYVAIPGVLTAAGIAMSIVPSTIAATQGAKQGQAGLASGLVNTSRQIGGGLGLVVLITLATQHSSSLIGDGHQVNAALTSGFRLAYFIAAGLCALAALMTFLALPAPPASLARASRRFVPAVGVALLAFVGLSVAFEGNKGAPLGQYTTAGTYRYVTAPSLHPPIIKRVQPAKGSQLAPGYIFATNFYDLNKPPIRGQSGPMILGRDLQPVWFQPVPEQDVASNLTLQSYEGKPVLGWWQGKVTKSGQTETGEDVIVDQHYRTVARLRATGGWVLTLHELQIDSEGHAWVTANKNIAKDLSSYGGAYNGALVDVAVQEYDLASGKLMRSWDALQHISPRESVATVPTNGFPWDAYHVNSIQLVAPGKFLVSMRNTWAAYLVDAATGRIEWTLGGRKSSFRFGPGAGFEWQHDVRLQPGGVVSLFDDHCCQLTGGGTSVEATAPSRGLTIRLQERAKTASLVSQYGEREGFESEYMGDTQPLAGGGAFVGWGSERYFSEYDSSGKVQFEGILPEPDRSYRAQLEPWEGVPETKPAAAARREGSATKVYASWNGATKLVSWRVLGATAAGTPMKQIASAPRSGFETAISVPASYASFEVQALDAAGHVLATSSAFAAA
ncbi:MAG TPA: MFS transporter [Solirubrobacteraceae bacterium]|nr:MFS transporter [Solirubrobacteraceae bacterium]